MMEMIKNEESTDIFNFVLGMRQQRNYMVQTEVRLKTVDWTGEMLLNMIRFL